MEEQIPSSQPPIRSPEVPQQMQAPQMQQPSQITPEVLELMKAKAREMAVQQIVEQRAVQPSAPTMQPQKVVYVRRNLTVAELILIFALSCGLVTGIQFVWHTATTMLPRIEVRVK